MQDDNNLVGTIVDGRYRIIRQLGSGGMGEVYLGEHIQLGRQEALKVLKVKFAKDPVHLARFRREARATNRVQHPNIVSFYDFGKLADDRFYLSMEFADGPNFKERIKKEGRFELPLAIVLLKQLALAINYAHKKNVIHRDLKPQNIVVVSEAGHPDTIKVLDFGVAKIMTPEFAENPELTQDVPVFGTPAYISPEQIKGVSDDSRSDIYALGCIAYEMLTGKPPFCGPSIKVLQSHISDTPIRPSLCNPEANIPTILDNIILNCLIKDPNNRIQTGAIFAEVLSALPIASSVKTAKKTNRLEKERSEFEQAPTVQVFPELSLQKDSLTESTEVCQSHSEVRQQEIIRRLAEHLTDYGCPDPLLLIILAETNQLQKEIIALDEELSELSKSDQQVAQTALEQTGALRFSIGEVRFSMEGQTESEKQVATKSLEKRLHDSAVYAQVQHTSIAKRQIEKIAERACKKEGLQKQYHELDLLVDIHSRVMQGNPVIAQLLHERRTIKRHIEAEATMLGSV